MSDFTFEPAIARSGAPIAGLYLVAPQVWRDPRGYFMETYNAQFEPYLRHLDGSPARFVQDNESRSSRGVLRGLHFQKQHPQGKLVRVIDGEVYDVAVDLRRSSPTFGCSFGVVLSGENKRQFLIPEGFAHGFFVLSQYATFVYKCTNYYDPADEGGLRWDDPALQIDWPVAPGQQVTLSDKDQRYPPLEALGFAFD